MTELPNFYPAHPEIILACAAMAYMLIGVFVREERAMGIVHYLSLAALIVVGIAVLPMRGQELIDSSGRHPPAGRVRCLSVILGSRLLRWPKCLRRSMGWS